MGLVINIILTAIALTTFAIAGGYITNAAVRITGIPEYQSANQDLVSAHKWASIAAVVTWISIALLIVGIVLYIIFAFESVELTGKFFIYALLFLALTGNIVVGILSALTASDINKSGVPDNNLSYRQSIIAAVLAIVTFVFILVTLILTFVYKPKIKKKSGEIVPGWITENIGMLGEF